MWGWSGDGDNLMGMGWLCLLRCTEDLTEGLPLLFGAPFSIVNFTVVRILR